MRKPLWRALVFLFIMIAFITMYCTSAQPAQASEKTFPEISNKTTLLFLGNENIAPIVYLDGTTPSGVVVDIVHALAKHIPQPIEIRAMNWSEAQVLVAQGKADALMQINPTEERLQIYDFSDTLLESQFSIFTRADKMGISGLSSLRGLRVGVESGGLPSQVLKKDPDILLTIIPNFTEGFKQLNEGSLDAVVVDYLVGSYTLAENNIRNIKVTGDPIASSNSSFAVKKGNTRLLNEINTALQIIKTDGTYQKIITYWKPTEGVFQTREQITEEIYRITILILLVLFLIAVIWMVTVKRELTKRKTIEKKLREQYSTLHGIINSVNALIFSLDQQYRYTSFNQGHAAVMKTIYGADIEPDHSILDYMTVPEDWETTKHNLDRALSGEKLVEEAYSGEEFLSRKYFLVSHSPIRNEKEEIIGVAVLAQDITDRKLSEEALQKSEERFRVLFEKATEAILVYDVDLDRLIDANVNAELLFGCERTELTKYSPAYFYSPDQADDLSVMEKVRDRDKRVVNGEEILFEQVIRSMKGDIHICEVRLVRLPSSEKKLIRASFIDVTERKKVERQLIQYRDHLEELVRVRTDDLQIARDQAVTANNAKSTFLSSMSHELRTPLNAILGFADLLIKQENLSARQREQLNIIKSSGEQLLTLINDILDVCKFEAQRMELEETSFNLPGFLRQVISITKIKADRKELTLIFQEESALPEYVKGDERKLRQILFNLLDNAIKYTNHGTVTLRAGYSREGSGILTCTIIDTGIGIPKDKQEMIFEPFSHLDTDEKKYEGVGLGLTIVKQLVKLMKGRIDLESEPQKGSMFKAMLPIPMIEEGFECRKPTRLIVGYQGERKKILVVDDNATNASLLVSILEPLDFRVITTDSGEDAVKKALIHLPDLILLDLVMPDMDGVETGKALRDHSGLRNLKIIGVSAAISDGKRIREFEDICDNFLAKPVDCDILLENIRDQLGISWLLAPSLLSESPVQKTQTPLKVPPGEVLSEIEKVVIHGQFGRSLDKILTDLQELDPAYAVFIDQIREYAREYNDEGILSYIGKMKGYRP